MRTTLKRGTGSNGANGPATLSSLSQSPLTHVTRYQARPRGPLRVVGRILLWMLLVLLVAAGALAGGVWLFFTQSVAAVRPHSPEVREAQRILDTPLPGEPAVAIVIGYDKRAGVDKSAESRSDTLMLLRTDPGLKTISMLSFPRDLVVDIPGCEGQPPFRGRINEAFTYCGPRGTLRTVKELTGIPINYMITVNFRAFIDIVNKLGGAYVDIDRRYFNDNSGLAAGQTFATIDLHPGYQRLDGRSGLDFVRYRHSDSDLYRVVRQQEFVKSLKQQVSSSWTLLQLPGIVSTITHNVEVAKGGNQELDPQEVQSYARLIYSLPSGNFHQVQLEGLTGYAELAASEISLQEAVNAFMNPDVEAAERSATAATGVKPPKPSAPAPSSVSVEVVNGNGVAGAADDAAVRLGQRGYQVTNGGNADSFDYFESLILYDPAQPEAEAAARALADLFGDAEVEAAPAGDAMSSMLRVVVGQTFHGNLTPSTRDRTPAHQPPNVAPDSGRSLELARAARRKLDFELLVPALVEATSAPDSEEPARAYRIGQQDAFRLVYRTGGGEYWGIQETTWTDAPVLDGASVTQTIGGREYRLYFDGARLHRVAFEENGAVYWVTNTLLNRLSNETMLAVAKSLRPVRG